MKPRGALVAATLTVGTVGCVVMSAWFARSSIPTFFSTPTLADGTRVSPGLAARANLPETAAANEFFDGSQFRLGSPAAVSIPEVEFAKAKTESVNFLEQPDGTSFAGDVYGGAPSGWGIFNQPNGTRLEGVWHHGMPSRLSGRAVLPSGTVEEGTWDYVSRTGHGTIVWKDGHTYTGDWKIGSGDSEELPEGFGTMSWPDGHNYVGRFLDGQMHGWGTMTQTDGKVVDSLWRHGTFVMTRIDH